MHYDVVHHYSVSWTTGCFSLPIVARTSLVVLEYVIDFNNNSVYEYKHIYIHIS